jgi:Tol biopolymer transport system component
VIGAYAQSWQPAELTVPLAAPFLSGEWAPSANVFAALDTEGNLYLVPPDTRAARVVKPDVTAYAWAAGDRLVFATDDAGKAGIWRSSTSGAWAELARVQSPVIQFFPSPDAEELAFAQDDAAGWTLMSVNATGGRLRDFGNLGQENSLAKAPTFAVAWSPDGSRLAVGPITEPFTLYVLQPGVSGAEVSSYKLEKGYAGELKWAPDGSQLAISTYAPNRVWHEAFVLSMDRLDSGPRFLLDGCEIVWSPDGLFIAVKREASRAQAMAAVRVATGEYWHVLNLPNLVPVAWGPDSDTATQQALQPVRRSGQLGK